MQTGEEKLRSSQAKESSLSRRELGRRLGQGVVAHAHNSSIWEAEAEQSL